MHTRLMLWDLDHPISFVPISKSPTQVFELTSSQGLPTITYFPLWLLSTIHVRPIVCVYHSTSLGHRQSYPSKHSEMCENSTNGFTAPPHCEKNKQKTVIFECWNWPFWLRWNWGLRKQWRNMGRNTRNRIQLCRSKSWSLIWTHPSLGHGRKIFDGDFFPNKTNSTIKNDALNFVYKIRTTLRIANEARKS